MDQVRPRVKTRERLLDAAEELLLQYGYEAVSVRGICQQAEANPAAVHYHFGSKEQLVAALLEARLAPVWSGRLDEISSRSLTVEELVEAVCAPIDGLLDDPVGALRLSLLSRFVLAHPETRWHAPWFGIDGWAQALQKARPELDDAEARRRCRLAFALLMAQLAPGAPLPPPVAAGLRAFLIAGLST
ncbi:helix-turn-helix domain-containing protein [Gordonia caeni]|uniref:HTH tetR-type domain-containing protein n=1 Tax=Gordonia caeni TaxID=1007097 RepID=A0ABP7PS55_9ACTN